MRLTHHNIVSLRKKPRRALFSAGLMKTEFRGWFLQMVGESGVLRTDLGLLSFMNALILPRTLLTAVCHQLLIILAL